MFARSCTDGFVRTFVLPLSRLATVAGLVTGNFAGWVGEQRQTFLGFNPTGGVNLRVTFILRPPAK